MIKNVLKRRKESGIYLVTDSRHRWRVQMTMKNALQLMKAAVPAESYILFIIFHRHLYSPAMSTVSSQVGALSFLFFNTFFIRTLFQNPDT